MSFTTANSSTVLWDCLCLTAELLSIGQMMGRRSPSSKREKRLKQKVKRKLFADSQVFPAQNTHANIPAEEIPCTSHTYNVHASVNETDTCLGEDVDVVTMCTEDSLKELNEEQFDYSYEYLLECREKLMHKVEEYRVCVEELTSKEASLIHKHRKENGTHQKLLSSHCLCTNQNWENSKSCPNE